MKVLGCFLLVFISGCSATKTSGELSNRILSSVMTEISDSDVGYGSTMCAQVLRDCDRYSEYLEWIDEDDQKNCSCN